MITLEDREGWNSIIDSFRNKDIYYLYDYVYSYCLHGDGEPLLIEYTDSEAHFCYPVMRSDISCCGKFGGRLEKGRYFDLETPYGYGGPLSDSTVSAASQRNFLLELTEYCRSEGIVSQFVRFHPLLRNELLLPEAIETRYMRDTIYIDTSSLEVIMSNMDSKNRNMIRKAEKNGVTAECRPLSEYHDFMSIYKETMDRNSASGYYYFREEYFEYQSRLENNGCIFYAMYEGTPIAAAMIFYNEKFMHYHLAGGLTKYRSLAAGNLLLYEAACFASEMGISRFHLGGGIEPEDSLFGFKKQFNKNGRLPFYIGRTVFDRESYDMLMGIRKALDPGFDTDNGRMIQYRR